MCEIKNTSALALFGSIAGQPKWLGRNISAWSEAVTMQPDFAPKLDRLDRHALTDALKDISLEQAFIAISAWGSMRVPNGRIAWAQRANWLPAVKSLSECKSRMDAYNEMRKLRAKGQLPGVGPAYFTKLIFFLRPELNAYIMDQWTAKSINLLTASTLVKLAGSWVSDKNNEHDYENFCRCVECIAEQVGLAPADCEERLFGYGSKWREFVKSQSQPT